MIKDLDVSHVGIELITEFEGLELEAYYCIAKKLTIGYGHTGPDVYEGQRISVTEAEQLLYKDLQTRVGFLNGWMRRHKIQLTQPQFDACISFIYNCGRSAYRRSSIARNIKAGDFLKAADSFMLWNKARVNGVLTEVRGLTRRRSAERGLFLKPPLMRETSNNPSNPTFERAQITNIRPIAEECGIAA